MTEKLSDMLTEQQVRALNTHAAQLIDLFEDAEYYVSQILDIEFMQDHVNEFDQKNLKSVHRSIKKRRRIGECPVEAFLSSCPNLGSELYYQLWLTKSRAWYLYKRYRKRFGFIGLLFRMLDSVRLIIERDDVIYLKNHLYLTRGIGDELQNIKLSENSCGNTDEDLSYLRKISPYRLMLEYDAVDRIENPRPSFRKKKIPIYKKGKHKKSETPSIASGGTGYKTIGNKKSRRIRKLKRSAHGRLQHLEKKSKSLTTNASIPSDMAVQELLKILVVPPPMEKRPAYTAIAYILVYGASLRKMFDAQSNDFISIIVDIQNRSATTRCLLKADPDDKLVNLFNSSSQHDGVRIKSNILECLGPAWSLRDFISEDRESIVHNVGLILKSVRADRFYITSSGLSKYRAAWMANRNVDYAEISLLHGESNPDAAGVNYHLISSQQLQRTHDRFEQYIGHGIEELNQCAEREGQSENVGSSVVMLDDKISAIFNWVCARLASHRYSDPAEHHNLLTLLTDQVLRLSSGYRAVNHPWWRRNNVDLETGVMHISDKDLSVSSITGRIIILPEFCMAYLAAYLDYLHSSLYVSAYNAALGNYRKLIFENKRPVLFYLVNGYPSSVRPKLNSEFMAELAALPPNWHRHYIRSALRRSGISGDLVDLWMGHDIAGSDPLHEFSGLSMSDLRKISCAINSIMVDHLKIPNSASVFE